MTSPINGNGREMQAIDVLEALTSLLGSSGGTETSSSKGEEWAKLPWEAAITQLPTSETGGEDMSNGCDFSSFPSFSLQKKDDASVEEHADALLHQKEGVKSHVASLLSRPILVSNDPEKRSVDDDEEEDDESEFMEESITKVPQLMQQNLVLSFSTLVQSRLRAYATFLARHGLSMAATSRPADDPEDSAVGVEQKLETLLELGNLVALGDVHMSFTVQREKATAKADGNELIASMPVSLKASISVLIPTLDGTQDCLTMDLSTSGSIAGIFANTGTTSSPLLRVVQVDLDMPRLLSSMKEGAASTVSRIVEMTNAAYSVPLPRVLSRDLAPGAPLPQIGAKRPLLAADANSRKRRSHIIEDDHCIVTPDLGSEAAPCSHPSDLDLVDLEEDVSSLSPDKCGKIVDCVFDKIDVRVLSPPGKRARFNPEDDVDAIALTLPVV